MQNLKLKSTLLLLFVLFSNLAISQNTINKESSYVSVNMSFINNAVFMGRKDSVATPYLYPSIIYHNSSGFYASGSFSYLTKSSKNRIDLFLISAGYDFSIKKLEGDISATKYSFNEDSNNVISEIEVDITASLKYDFNIVNLGLTANTYFNKSNRSDFFLSSEISRDFISNNQKFQISPTAGIYLGTQNFYEEYYINNRFGNGRSGQGSGQGSGGNIQTTTEIGIQEKEQFNLMAIEFSLPMWYEYESFIFSFLPTLAIPQNEATLEVDNLLVEEDLEPIFYWVFNVNYKF